MYFRKGFVYETKREYLEERYGEAVKFLKQAKNEGFNPFKEWVYFGDANELFHQTKDFSFFKKKVEEIELCDEYDFWSSYSYYFRFL